MVGLPCRTVNYFIASCILFQSVSKFEVLVHRESVHFPLSCLSFHISERPDKNGGTKMSVRHSKCLNSGKT